MKKRTGIPGKGLVVGTMLCAAKRRESIMKHWTGILDKGLSIAVRHICSRRVEKIA